MAAQNTYGGQTLIAGNVQLATCSALPPTTVVQVGDPTLGSGVLDLNGYNQTLAGLLTGAGKRANNTDADEVTGSSGTASTLTVKNAADYTFAGRLEGNVSLAKYGTAILTLTGDCTSQGQALVYDGTLDIEGTFLGTAQTVAGYGNPQLVLPGDPDYYVVTPPTFVGLRGYSITGYLTSSGNVMTYGDNWMEAVQAAVNSSGIYIVQNAANLSSDYWNFQADSQIIYPSDSPYYEPVNGSVPFLIGTAGDIDYDVDQTFKNGTTWFNMTGLGLSANTPVIAMEDEIGQSWCDHDYNDAVWVAQVQQVPAVTGISPVSGPWVGGTSVTITGSGFSGATAVEFGTAAASSFSVNSAGTQITAVSPAAAAGAVDVTVVTAGGTSLTSSADEFSYLPTNSVTTLVSSQNPATQGQPVTFTATVSGDATGTVTFDNEGGPISRRLPLAETTNYAMQLDGTSGYMYIPPTNAAVQNQSLNMGGSSLTLAMWIKPSQSYTGEELGIEHGIWQQSVGMYQLTTLGSDTVRFNFPALNSNEGPLDATVNLDDGNWHFLVATFNNNTHIASIYDNGVLLNSKTVAEPIASDNSLTTTYVGCRGNGSLFFDGGIGEVLIYNQAISAQDIATLEENPGPSLDVATGGRWPRGRLQFRQRGGGRRGAGHQWERKRGILLWRRDAGAVLENRELHDLQPSGRGQQHHGGL